MTLKALVMALMEMVGAQAGSETHRRIVNAAPAIHHVARTSERLLVGAIVTRESNWDTSAVGRRGERGLMQIAPSTIALYCKDLADAIGEPVENIKCGLRVFRRAMRECHGVVAHALSRYNGAGTCRETVYSARVLSLLPENRRRIVAMVEQ